MVEQDKEVVALLTTYGYAVYVTPVTPSKEGRGFDFDNANKLYGRKADFEDLAAGRVKSVKLYHSDNAPVKRK